MHRLLTVVRDESRKQHLAKRIPDPFYPRHKMWTSLCDVNDKGWYCDVGEKVLVRDIPARVGCRRCIRLAGFEAARQKYELNKKEGRMPIKIDFTGVSSNSDYAALPEGEYSAVISKASQGVSQAGNPKIEVEFDLENGRKQWRHFALTAKALWAFKQFLEDLDFDIPEGEFDFDEQELVGEKVILTLGIRPHYQDPSKEDNEVTAIRRDGF